MNTPFNSFQQHTSSNTKPVGAFMQPIRTHEDDAITDIQFANSFSETFVSTQQCSLSTVNLNACSDNFHSLDNSSDDQIIDSLSFDQCLQLRNDDENDDSLKLQQDDGSKKENTSSKENYPMPRRKRQRRNAILLNSQDASFLSKDLRLSDLSHSQNIKRLFLLVECKDRIDHGASSML